MNPKPPQDETPEAPNLLETALTIAGQRIARLTQENAALQAEVEHLRRKLATARFRLAQAIGHAKEVERLLDTASPEPPSIEN